MPISYLKLFSTSFQWLVLILKSPQIFSTYASQLELSWFVDCTQSLQRQWFCPLFAWTEILTIKVLTRTFVIQSSKWNIAKNFFFSLKMFPASKCSSMAHKAYYLTYHFCLSECWDKNPHNKRQTLFCKENWLSEKKNAHLFYQTNLLMLTKLYFQATKLHSMSASIHRSFCLYSM